MALSAALLLASESSKAAPSAGAWGVCASLIEAAEQALELPPHLLQAISKVESGRWNKEAGARLAWPWTVMAEGKGRYLPTKAAAIAEVEELQARGVRNIDVGCTQVNLKYHGDAFDTLSQALDPVHNVAYAAVFLSQLRSDSRSWTKAVGRYHSSTPKLGGRYRTKVFRAWRDEKKAAYRRDAAVRKQQREAASIGSIAGSSSILIAEQPAAGQILAEAADRRDTKPKPAPEPVTAPKAVAAAQPVAIPLAVAVPIPTQEKLAAEPMARQAAKAEKPAATGTEPRDEAVEPAPKVAAEPDPPARPSIFGKPKARILLAQLTDAAIAQQPAPEPVPTPDPEPAAPSPSVEAEPPAPSAPSEDANPGGVTLADLFAESR